MTEDKTADTADVKLEYVKGPASKDSYISEVESLDTEMDLVKKNKLFKKMKPGSLRGSLFNSLLACLDIGFLVFPQLY